jgi:uncharacterized protein YuzE
MAKKLTFHYDRAGDILYIEKVPPYKEQESEELPDEVVARLNPETGEVESLEILFFSTRLLRSETFELPLDLELRLAS